MKVITIVSVSMYAITLLGFNELHSQTKTDRFDYFVRKSSYRDFKSLNDVNRKWREIKNDTLVYTAYFKGAVCDIPNAEKMNINIVNDTIVFNFGLNKEDPDCERRFGVAGIMVDFVLNKKKFPDYRNLKIKNIIRN